MTHPPTVAACHVISTSSPRERVSARMFPRYLGFPQVQG
jgi:hypothetical protein